MAGELEQGMENSCIYKNRSEPVEARIKDLISRMTVEEKIGQMAQIERVVATPSVVREFFIDNLNDTKDTEEIRNLGDHEDVQGRSKSDLSNGGLDQSECSKGETKEVIRHDI